MLRTLRIGFAIYSLAVVIVSLIPGGDLTAPGELDKIGHFLAYAIMAFWGLSAFRTRRTSILVIIFCLLLGVGLEYLQQLVSGRDPSLADGLANFLGVFVGTLIYFLWRRFADARIS